MKAQNSALLGIKQERGLLKIEEPPRSVTKRTKPYPPGRIKQSCSSSLSGVMIKTHDIIRRFSMTEKKNPKEIKLCFDFMGLVECIVL